MFSRLTTSIENAKQMKQSGEVWPSVVLAAAIPLIAGEDKGRFANDLYFLLRKIDDIVDESDGSYSQKIALVNKCKENGKVVLTDGNLDTRHEQITAIAYKIKHSPHFNEKLQKYYRWALKGMKKELRWEENPEWCPSEYAINDMRTRAVFPYIMMATELMNGNSIDFGCNESTKNLIRLSRSIAKGGDLRDIEEDIKGGRMRFTQRERISLNLIDGNQTDDLNLTEMNFSTFKEGLMSGFRCFNLKGLNRTESAVYSIGSIIRNSLLYIRLALK
jgi:hypothetical protein